MKELGLACLVRMKKYRSHKRNIGKVASNILTRNFQTEKLNKKQVTDITKFKVLGEIITYTISSKQTYSLVSNMLNQALDRLTEVNWPLIHLGQGWHYQIDKYRCSLAKHSIMSQNTVIENFFSIMKSEFLYL
ncbi:hypothetical protein COD21_30440 [Bacillus cereus]|uniref:hypothetical protein n=1 Tax=Bacillus cereus TaxID=1396 RepID=UPI000BFE2C6C|nr:hypothetical protein [Bacillus cereus]PGU00836.1 hypothetical protein COD21_30440 [Bacillus cereus]